MTVAYAAIFGLVFGSFVNAAIDRIPRGRSLNGRSQCDGCGVQLKAVHLVPLISYLALRGRCAACATPIGLRTPIVEVGCAIGFAAIFAALPAAAAVAACASFVAVVVTLGVFIEKRGLKS